MSWNVEDINDTFVLQSLLSLVLVVSHHHQHSQTGSNKTSKSLAYTTTTALAKKSLVHVALKGFKNKQPSLIDWYILMNLEISVDHLNTNTHTHCPHRTRSIQSIILLLLLSSQPTLLHVCIGSSEHCPLTSSLHTKCLLDISHSLPLSPATDTFVDQHHFLAWFSVSSARH